MIRLPTKIMKPPITSRIQPMMLPNMGRKYVGVTKYMKAARMIGRAVIRVPGGARLGGQGRDLALDPDALANRVSDVVQDLGEVATTVRWIEYAVATRSKSLLTTRLVMWRGPRQGPAEVHLAYGAAELVADGRHRVLGHGVDGLRERVAGFQRVRQQLSVSPSWLLNALTAADPVFHVHAGTR